MSIGIPQNIPDSGDQAYFLRIQQISRFLKSKKLMSFPCLLCKQQKGMTLLGFKHETTVISTSTIGRYYMTYALSCNHCGFIHEFNANLVDADLHAQDASGNPHGV